MPESAINWSPASLAQRHFDWAWRLKWQTAIRRCLRTCIYPISPLREWRDSSVGYHSGINDRPPLFCSSLSIQLSFRFTGVDSQRMSHHRQLGDKAFGKASYWRPLYTVPVILPGRGETGRRSNLFTHFLVWRVDFILSGMLVSHHDHRMNDFVWDLWNNYFVQMEI